MIRNQESYQANIPIRQYNDAGTYRCRCSDSGEHCHLNVDVIPDTVKANFTLAFLNMSYNGSCSAKGNPLPLMRAEFDSNGCNYTTTMIDIDGDFTRHLIITIPTVTEHCQDVTITCFACHIHTTIELNVITDESERTTPIPPITHHPESERGRGTSTVHGTSLSTLVLAGVIAAEIWKLCMQQIHTSDDNK